MLAMHNLVNYVILTILALSIVQAYIVDASIYDNTSKVKVVAVSSLPNGSYVGVTADLYVRVVCPGSGHVFVETLPLSQIDLQASTRIAALVASRLAGVDFMSCDYYMSIKAESPIVGGPSASAVTSAAFAASLLGIPIHGDVIMTGMIMPDGSIGPVGGLKAKLEAAAGVGAKKFLVPYGQTYDVSYVTVEERRGNLIIYRTQQVVTDLIDYGRKLGVEVIPIANIYDALEILSDGLFKVLDGGGYAVISRMRSKIDPIFAEWVGDISGEVRRYVSDGDSIKGNVLKTLSGTDVQYVRNLLSSIELSINNTVLRANMLESQQLLYAASSAYFQALIHAKWRYHLLKTLLDRTYLTSEARNVNKSINDVITTAHNLVGEHVDLGVINVLANVLERAYDALIYLNNSLSSQELSTSTYYLGLADARVYTAKLWLKLLEHALVGEYVSSEDLSNMVVNIEALAQNIYAYIIAFSNSTKGQSDILNDAYIRYTLMSSLSNNLDKFAVGLSSLGYMYLTLTSMFTNNYTASVEALNRTISLILSMLNTTTPIDVVAYMELANAYTSDPQYQTYMLARLSMLLSTYLSLKYVGKALPYITTTQQPCSEVVTKTVVVTETKTVGEVSSAATNYTADLMTSLIALILLVLIAIVLLGVRIPEQIR